MALALSDSALETRLKKGIAWTDIELEGYSGTDNAWQRLVQSCADLIVIGDAIFPEPIESGIAVLTDLPEKPTVIVFHDIDSTDVQARCIAAGAYSALYSGTSEQHLLRVLETAVEAKRQLRLLEWGGRKKAQQPKMEDLSSGSETMQIFMNEVLQVADSDSMLLVTGETGVGKEHLAKVVHAESPRSAGPFIAVNTAALPEQLLESELFGHRQGAFTGATRSRRGAFELAHGGTIFLDEIGEMPLHLQAKLLRVLQDYEIRPLGAEKASWVDVRVIAATNRNLEEAVAEGTFRKDLYYRLSVVCLQIPPLRMRKEDIPQLARRFVADFKVKIGRDIRHISESAMAAMCQYDWPGNVRELMNVIERSMLLCKTSEIQLENLPSAIHKFSAATAVTAESALPRSWSGMTLREVMAQSMESVEKNYLIHMLEDCQGRVGEAASRAGISSRSLYTKMKKYDLEKKDFKTGKRNKK